MNLLLKSEMTKLTKSRPLRLVALLMLALSAVTSLSSLSYVNSPLAEELEIVFYGYDAFFHLYGILRRYPFWLYSLFLL